MPAVADTSYQGEENLTFPPRFPRTGIEADGELGYPGEGTGWKRALESVMRWLGDANLGQAS